MKSKKSIRDNMEDKRPYRKIKELDDRVEVSTVEHKHKRVTRPIRTVAGFTDRQMRKRSDWYARLTSKSLVNEYAIKATNLREKYEKKLSALSLAIRKGNVSEAMAIKTALIELQKEALKIKTDIDDEISTKNILALPLIPELNASDELELYREQILIERALKAKEKEVKTPSKKSAFKELPKEFIESEAIIDTLALFNSYTSKQRLNEKTAIIFNEDEQTGNAVFTTKLSANTTSKRQERLMIAMVDYGTTDEINMSIALQPPTSLSEIKDSSFKQPTEGSATPVGKIDYQVANKGALDKLSKIIEIVASQKFGDEFNQIAFKHKTKNAIGQILNDIHSQGDDSTGDLIIRKDGEALAISVDTGTGTSFPITIKKVFREKRL